MIDVGIRNFRIEGKLQPIRDNNALLGITETGSDRIEEGLFGGKVLFVEFFVVTIHPSP